MILDDIDLYGLRERQNEQCQRLMQGECFDRRCLKRGGRDYGGLCSPQNARCDASDLVEALTELIDIRDRNR